jgi:hypothetical protein
MKRIASLKESVEQLHGCKAEWIESVPVKETFPGQTVWDGTVDVFALTGHPKANRCYAWAEGKADDRIDVMAVLELPPVDSAVKAVRVAIVSQRKSGNQTKPNI